MQFDQTITVLAIAGSTGFTRGSNNALLASETRHRAFDVTMGALIALSVAMMFLG